MPENTKIATMNSKPMMDENESNEGSMKKNYTIREPTKPSARDANPVVDMNHQKKTE